MKKLLLAAVIGGLSTAAAADYRAELTADYSNVDSDENRSYADVTYEETVFQFTGTLFFDSVSTDAVPVDEAGFLSKSSGVSFSNMVTQDTYKRKSTYSGYDNEYRDHYRQTGIGFRGVFGSGIFNIDFLQSYYDGESGAKLISIGGGAYLTDSAALTGRLIQVDSDGEKDNGLGINYHHVFNNNGDTSYLIDADFFKVDDYRHLALESAVFFTPNSKLFINFTQQAVSGRSYNTDELGIGYQHFFMNRIGLTARYANGDYSSPSSKKESYLGLELQVNI